jgi:hypothetical protein
VSASIAASRYIAAHPDQAAKFAAQQYPASNPEILTKTILALTSEKVWGVNGGIEPEMTQGTLRIALDTGLLKHPIAASTLFDTQFVDAALAKMGSQP